MLKSSRLYYLLDVRDLTLLVVPVVGEFVSIAY